jgi:hypothetical protein
MATSSLVEGGSFLPHGVCYLQQPNLILLHVVSDALVALAYFMIPLALIYVSRRIGRRVSFNWAIGLFAAFIILCGAGHVLDIVVIWKPVYWLQGWQRALTAIVSLATAFCDHSADSAAAVDAHARGARDREPAAARRDQAA